MADKEKIASAVQRIVNQVLKETYDEKIFDEIFLLIEFLEDTTKTYYRTELNLFEGFSITDLRKASTALKKSLLEKINHSEISFLQTMRLVQALDVVAPNAKFSKANPKVKFCLELWNRDVSSHLELVHLLDQM